MENRLVEGNEQEYSDRVLRTRRKLALLMLHQQNDRQILFVVDHIGNTGETWPAKYLTAQRKTSYCNSTNMKDTVHAYSKNMSDMVVIDLTWDKLEDLRYGELEALKNRTGFTTEYNNAMLGMPEHTRVIVMVNEEPDWIKMWADRWQILRLIQVPAVSSDSSKA